MRIRPTKRGWKRFGIALLILVAAVLVFNGVMAWRIEMHFRSKIAAIRAAGDPASISDLAPKPITEGENAAAIIKNISPRLSLFMQEYSHFLDTPVGEAFGKRIDRGDTPTPEQIVAIRAILDKYSDISKGISLAAACGQYASLSNYSVHSDQLIVEFLEGPMRKFREVQRFQDWRMESLVAEHEQEKAVAIGIEMLQLARLYDEEPLLANALVGIAIRSRVIDEIYDAITSGPISSKLCSELDSELAQNDQPQRTVHVVKTERAFNASAIEEFGSSLPNPFLARIFGWTIQRHFAGVLDVYDEELRLLTLPSWKVNKQAQHAQAEYGGKYGAIADLTIQGVQGWFESEMRCAAMTRALRIVNTIRAFAEKNGREPKGLEELGLPREATIDPFSGEPLKFKHTDDGWVVYSVMTNGVDDGGDFKDLKDYGVAPRKWRRVQ